MDVPGTAPAARGAAVVGKDDGDVHQDKDHVACQHGGCYDFICCSHSSFFFLTFFYGLTVATFLSIHTLPHVQHPSYSCAAMHSLFTLVQPLCTVCLLLRSRYAQSVYLCAALSII